MTAIRLALGLLFLLGPRLPAAARELDWSEDAGAKAAALAPPGTCTPGELFARTLITGASVSDDYKSASPGMLLARRYGAGRGAVKSARPGAPGRYTVARLSDSALENATVVVAVDLFFWDAAAASCGDGESAVDAFFSKLKAHRKPVVIGNIPPLERHTQCRQALNAKIKASCAAYSDCYFLDLEGLYVKIQADGGLTVSGRKYATRELLPDGLHPGLAGSEFMADTIVDVITRGGAESRIPCAK